MTTTVVDEREQTEDEQAPYEVTITPMTPDPAVHGSYTDPVILPYAPEDYEISLVPNWMERDAAGTSHLQQKSDFSHTTARQLSASSIIQPDEPGLCEDIRGHIELWAGRPTTIEGRPTLVQVQMGFRLIIGQIDVFRWTAVRTDAQGRIRTMDMSLTITENLDL